MDIKMKRRDFLKISALAGLAVVAAACQPTAVPATAVPAATAIPKAGDTAVPATAVPKATAVPATAVPKPTAVPKVAFQGEIEFYAQNYTPTSTLTNPDPKAPKRSAFQTLATEWEALHPGIKIKFHQGAPAGYQEYVDGWLNTQLIGGTGPDLFWLWLGNLNTFADEGKVVALNDYLELPNKYTPEDTSAWKTSFKCPFSTSFSPKGNWGGVPSDKVGIGVYANVDMFKAVGIDLNANLSKDLGMPKDWATMISWCKKLKEGGFNAFGMHADYLLDHWWDFTLSPQLFWSLIPTFDLLNYHADVEMKFQKGWINQEEAIMQYACNGWKPFEDPATRTMFEIIKELTLYMPEGFVTTTANELFMTNMVAMYWGGTWELGGIMQDNRRVFEFSSFTLPPVTKATTPLASDVPLNATGKTSFGGISYGINRKCITKGNIDECVDWLMYMNTAKNNEMIVNEIPSMVPAQVKARTLPEIDNMTKGDLAGCDDIPQWAASPHWWFDGKETRYSDAFKREKTLYYLGDIDLDTMMANMTIAAADAFPGLIRALAVQYSDTGSWDLTQWTCQPKV